MSDRTGRTLAFLFAGLLLCGCFAAGYAGGRAALTVEVRHG
jgi:hypothetical protein